jgi:lipopolysaccharide transport system permease protein
MAATNVPFTIYIIFTSLPIIALLFFTIGVGLIVATINVFFRDLQHLYGVLMVLLMYATPIFYPPSIVPASFRFIQDYNPIFAVIECCRSVFLYGEIYDPHLLIFALVSAAVAMIVGLALFYKFHIACLIHYCKVKHWKTLLLRLKMLK